MSVFADLLNRWLADLLKMAERTTIVVAMSGGIDS
jgi:NH3-dependent NAD+ synthetase